MIITLQKKKQKKKEDKKTNTTKRGRKSQDNISIYYAGMIFETIII